MGYCVRIDMPHAKCILYCDILSVEVLSPFSQYDNLNIVWMGFFCVWGLVNAKFLTTEIVVEDKLKEVQI